MSKPFFYEVKISWATDPYADNALIWLRQKKWRAERDWDIDMHGGRLDHTSFWFRDANKALIMKLTLGGV